METQTRHLGIQVMEFSRIGLCSRIELADPSSSGLVIMEFELEMHP